MLILFVTSYQTYLLYKEYVGIDCKFISIKKKNKKDKFVYNNNLHYAIYKNIYIAQ